MFVIFNIYISVTLNVLSVTAQDIAVIFVANRSLQNLNLFFPFSYFRVFKKSIPKMSAKIFGFKLADKDWWALIITVEI